MEMRHIKSLNADVSLLGFGLMRLPTCDEEGRDVDTDAAQRMVDYAVKHGINYFDTAYAYHYGNSERFIGGALSALPRDSYYLATKMPTWPSLVKTADDAERLFEKQLERCKTHYFDFYLAHCMTADTFQNFESSGMYDVLRRKKEQGLIRRLGMSSHSPTSLLERIVDKYEWEFVQIQLNYIDWEACDARGQYDILRRRGLPIVVMEPLRGGTMAALNDKAAGILRAANPDTSVASWGLRYAASLPGVMTVLSGMTELPQVEDNISTMSNFKPLTPEERIALEQARAAFIADGAIPCTGCRYCMDCPSGVDIPRVFSIYNHFLLNNSRIYFNNNYSTLLDTQRAGGCAACGACAPSCPQGIDIPARMKEISEFAEA